MFKAAAWLIDTFYAWVNNYAIAIGMVALAIMLLITPLTLKSTKGMLEMQRLQPEMKKLQNQYKGDRQKLNEEMMKLYQEHKINPLASCLPLLAQMPVFIIMFRVLHGLTYEATPGSGFAPKYISESSELFKSLPLLDWVNCVKGTPKSGKWASWSPCTSKTKWLVVEGIQVKGKITANYPKDMQAKADALCAKQAKPFLKKGAKTAPVAGLGPKKDSPQGDPFGDCFIALTEWNGKTG